MASRYCIQAARNNKLFRSLENDSLLSNQRDMDLDFFYEDIMAEPIIHSIGKLQDRQILALFSEIEDAFGSDDCQFQYGEIKISQEELIDNVGKGKSYVISMAHLITNGSKFQIHYCRGTGGNSIHQRTPSPYFDEIIVSLGTAGQGRQQQPTPQDCITFERIIAKFATTHIPSGAKNGVSDVIDMLQKEIADLAAFHKRMLEDSEEQRRKLELLYQQKHADLEARTAEDNKEIETRSRREREEIENLRVELEKARKAIDDRDHMHVRRDLRVQISNEIRERVSSTLLPAQTNRLGWVIFGFALFCSAAAGWIAYGSYVSFASLVAIGVDAPHDSVRPSDYLLVILAVRGAITSIVALGFLIYALSWLRKSYQQSVQTNNELQKYALDINRASWIIETIMEMTTKEGRVLPDKWIEGACHGLFKSAENSKQEITPLEAWGALLGVSGKVEFGPDGPKLEFNRGQARKLAKGTASE